MVSLRSFVTTGSIPQKRASAVGGYRPDIDGLRAIAVCLVIADHFGLSHSNGGYIGVDVFFVISGYLISSILIRELNEDRFSIAAFYERRIRRILPALMAVLLVTSVVAWRMLLPVDLMDYAKSLMSAMLSVSNYYFYRKSGYFDPSASMRPLLHTWSLAVEEQFYIFLPPFLLLIHRYARRWLFAIVVTVGAISFFASAILAFRAPVFDFFLAPTRAWELLLGTVLALQRVKIPEPKIIRNGIGAVGILLIFTGAALLGPTSPFPGATALFPCVGAALVILSGTRGGDTFVARALALRPVAFIGTISYSLYLWHWPLLCLRNYDFKESFPLTEHQIQLMLIVETFVLGFLSWRYIETPFRRGFRMPRRRLFQLTSSLAACVVLLAAATLYKQGFPNRFSPEIQRLATYQQVGGVESDYREGHCFLSPTQPGPLDDAMCMDRSTSIPNYVLAGSSHAADLWIGLSSVIPEINWQQISGSGCVLTREVPPTETYIPGHPTAEFPFCRSLRKLLYEKYLTEHKFDAIVLSTNWTSEDIPYLRQTLNYLNSNHIKVIVIGPNMEYDQPLPQLLIKQLKNGDHDLASSHLEEERFALNDSFAKLMRGYPNDTYISLTDLLCPRHVCTEFVKNDVPLQSDRVHLTHEGSIFVAERLRSTGFFKPRQ